MKISVVMAVYNGAATLSPTLDSILAQSEGDFELVIVDDGSTDETPRFLAEAAQRDGRIRIVTQPANAGLTRALIRGCDEARAELIARHDCGDRSHPDRFRRQLELMRPGVVLSACGMRWIGPEGVTLSETRLNGKEVRNSLLNDDARHIHGVPHASAMFRLAAYRAAGGYRPQFRMAQDLDLWIRMAPLGEIATVDDVLYDAVFTPKTISGVGRASQDRLTEIAVALRDGGDPETLLAEAARVPVPRSTRRSDAAALYFIAKCMRDQRHASWRRYLVAALRRNPLHWKAWASLFLR